MCSDGLTNMLHEDEIYNIINNNLEEAYQKENSKVVRKIIY